MNSKHSEPPSSSPVTLKGIIYCVWLNIQQYGIVCFSNQASKNSISKINISHTYQVQKNVALEKIQLSLMFQKGNHIAFFRLRQFSMVPKSQALQIIRETTIQTVMREGKTSYKL